MKADNAVNLAKFKYLIRLLNSLKKKKECRIDFINEPEEVEFSVEGTHESFKIVDRYLKFRGRIQLVLGLVVGIVLGLIAAYIVIPSGATYLYSSDKGLIPPKYDALFSTKKNHEKIMQILTHEALGEKKRRGGPHRSTQMLFTSHINDSTTIELWYKLSKKSIITNISQKKGEQFIRAAVKESMEKSGVDSAAKYYAGVEGSNVAGEMAEAVSRTSSMKVEQGFLSEPVIRIIIDGRDRHLVLTNYLPWEGSHDEEFSSADSDPLEISSKDNTRENRKLSVPDAEDQMLYEQCTQEFINSFSENKSLN